MLDTEDAGLFQAFKAITVLHDTIYTYLVNKGLTRYIWNSVGTVLTENTSRALEYSNPDFMAVDTYGLYLGYVKYGIYAFNKTSLEQTSYYRTGYGYNDKFGLQNLFCKDDYIFIVDYHAQTTILTNRDLNTGLKDIDRPINYTSTFVYPNPVHSQATFCWVNSRDKNATSIKIYNILGQVVYSHQVIDEQVSVDLNNFISGVYVYNLLDMYQNKIAKGKFLVQ